MKYNVNEYPKMLPICIEEGFCNLACPKCPVHGDNPRHNDIVKGRMSLENAEKIFNEVEGHNVLVTPSGVTEPFVKNDFFKYVDLLNKRNISITINSNGLLIDEEMAEKIVNDYSISSIFISVDAMTSETLSKVRDTVKLEKINDAVFCLLKARGEKITPRIGVSFTTEDANKMEKDSFIKYWIQYVDAIRVNELYQYGDEKTIQGDRPPCPVLYDTLFIGINGNARICCLDVFDKTSVGNVLETSVREVWNGEKMNQVRKFHEIGEFDKVDLCKNCQDWSRYIFNEEYEKDGLLIRKSKLLTYYNRLDRMKNWRM